jgi:hypothetical protein
VVGHSTTLIPHSLGAKLALLNSEICILIKVGDTVSAPVSVWPLEWNISIPIDTDQYRHFVSGIYIKKKKIKLILSVSAETERNH